MGKKPGHNQVVHDIADTHRMVREIHDAMFPPELGEGDAQVVDEIMRPAVEPESIVVPSPDGQQWDWGMQGTTILLNGVKFISRGMNGYAVKAPCRPYKMGEKGGEYLDHISNATGDIENRKKLKQMLPTMNTDRILISPRIIDPDQQEARDRLEEYARHGMQLGNQVVGTVYGMSDFGGTDFPERSAKDGPDGIVQDEANWEGIANRCIAVHKYLAEVAAKYPNFTINLVNEPRMKIFDGMPGSYKAHPSGINAWIRMNTLMVQALRETGYQGIIYVDVGNWATHCTLDSALAVLAADPLKRIAFSFHLYADGGSYNKLNPVNLEWLPGMKEMIDAGLCVGVGEVGLAVAGGLNGEDGGPGPCSPYMQKWGDMFRGLSFVWAWQTLNDHNGAIGPIKVSKTSKGGIWAAGSWYEVSAGIAPFELNAVGECYRDTVLRL